MPEVEVWQEPSRFWRWRYLEPSADGQPLELLSSETYRRREDAVAAAMTAYPGVPVRELGAPPGTTPPSSPPRRRSRVRLLALGALVVGLVLWRCRDRRTR